MLGIASLSAFGSFGAGLEIVLILYPFIRVINSIEKKMLKSLSNIKVIHIGCLKTVIG